MQISGNIKAISNTKIKDAKAIARALADIIHSQTGVKTDVRVYLTPKSKGQQWRNSSKK